jgi:hypothetical protein
MSLLLRFNDDCSGNESKKASDAALIVCQVPRQPLLICPDDFLALVFGVEADAFDAEERVTVVTPLAPFLEHVAEGAKSFLMQWSMTRSRCSFSEMRSRAKHALCSGACESQAGFVLEAMGTSISAPHNI